MKRGFATALLLVVSLGLFAQVIHDPNDPIYTDLDRWAVRGYIASLPPIRPYPAQLLDELLTRVTDSGDASARAKAQAYRAALAPEARSAHVGVTGTLLGEGSDASAYGAPTVDGTLRFEPLASASYSLAIYGTLREPGEEKQIPGAYSPYPDFVADWAGVGPISVLQDWTSALAVGTADLYFQAGLNRTSFGPFFDNGIVVGAQAGRAGHFSLNYRRDTWSIGVLLLEIAATDDYGDGQYPDKHLILHSFDFRPRKNLELGFFESVVWGGRWEMLYMAPFNQYFAAQSMAGFEDNSLFGLHGRWTAAPALQLLGQVYVDDLNFNDVVAFKLDTKYKLAGELGLRCAPEKSPLVDLAADYTAVMPYMYTHITGEREDDRYVAEKPNYYNYTHRGAGLGTDLQPNSDRFSVRSSWRMPAGLELSLSGYLTRHGNASADEDAGTLVDDPNDGSILDDGYDDDTKATFHYETRFLTQDVIDTRLAAGAGLNWTLPIPFGFLTASADYVFEYGWNRDLVSGDDGISHFWTMTGGWRW